MPEIIWPTSTAPGVNPVESGGRLINAYAEKAPDGSRSKIILRRSPGLTAAFETQASHRGALLVGSVLYVVSDDKAYSITKAGAAYTVTELTGSASGSGKITLARNMNATPQVLIVHSGGMDEISTSGGSIASFSDADLPALNSICFVGGYFFGTVGDGRVFASGLNAVTFASTDFARAESSPDGLIRGIRYGRDLALMGEKTIEFWGNVGNPTGFPFSFSSVIPVGLISTFAVAGMEAGFGESVVFVAADRTVQRLSGYSAQKISTPDLDRLIEQVEDPDDLEMSVYVAAGHSCAALSCDDWTWVYDMTAGYGTWHERKSYGQERWRAGMGVNAFDEWLTFDTDTADVYRVDASNRREGAYPLVWEVRSTQAHRFPKPMRVSKATFDFVTGVGRAAGITGTETDPQVSISWSDDGGRTFGNELLRRLGGEGEQLTVGINNCGRTGAPGRQWKLSVSDPVEVALMGGAMEVS